MRLFLCDDNAGYRLLARRVLEQAGHEVVGEAGDGQAAIEKAPATSPDVVLLDLNMPRTTGFEALPDLLRLLPSSKIVILTTGQAPAERQRALDAGAHAFIVKPERIHALDRELETALTAS
jgi:two-component system, chemotaxis family, chemotaxis protein CheY